MLLANEHVQFTTFFMCYLLTNKCNSPSSSLCYLPMNMCNSQPSLCATYLLRYIKQYNLLYMLLALEHVIHSLLDMLLANEHKQFTAFFIYYLLTNMCNSKPHQQTYAIHSLLHLQLANKHVQFTFAHEHMQFKAFFMCYLPRNMLSLNDFAKVSSSIQRTFY